MFVFRCPDTKLLRNGGRCLPFLAYRCTIQITLNLVCQIPIPIPSPRKFLPHTHARTALTDIISLPARDGVVQISWGRTLRAGRPSSCTQGCMTPREDRRPIGPRPRLKTSRRPFGGLLNERSEAANSSSRSSSSSHTSHTEMLCWVI